MRDEYEIDKLNPRPNPYISRLKNTITISIDAKTAEYFKAQSQQSGIPYQELINMYLSDCAENDRLLKTAGE